MYLDILAPDPLLCMLTPNKEQSDDVVVEESPPIVFQEIFMSSNEGARAHAHSEACASVM